MIDSEYNRLKNRISFWCLIVSIVIGALAILGWLLGLAALTQFSSAYIPMAPSTALFFVILGLIALVRFGGLNPSKEQKPQKYYLYLLTALAVIDIIIMAEFIVSYQRLDIENILVQKPGYLGSYLLGRMSPLTGFLFLLEIVALWIFIKGNDKSKTIASISTTIGSLITLILILGYVYGAPLLYHRNVIPPAFNTSVAFAFSFAAILIGFGGGHWPIKLFIGKSVRSRLMRTLLPAVILIIILSGWIASMVYYSTEDHLLMFSIVTILTVFMVSYVISKISHSIGSSFDAAFEKIKRAESSLRESEEKFRSLAEESPNMIFINKNGHIVYVNKKCEEVMGYARQEFYDSKFNFLDLIAPEDVERVQQAYSRRLAGVEQIPYDYKLITKKGKRIDVTHNAKMIDYENGKAILGIITEITNRKQFEEELVKNELRYRILFENTPIGIVIMDEHQNVMLINKAFESIFQYSLDEIKGRYIDDVIVPSELYNEAGNFFSSIVDGNVIAKETVRKRKDNSLVNVQVYGFPVVVNRKCIGIYGMYADLTERKRTEQRVADMLKLNETILQTSPVGIVAYRKNGQAIFANEAAAQIIGATLDQVSNQNFRQLHSWKVSGLFDVADKVLRTGSCQSMEAHFISTFGKEIWISCRFELFKYENEEHLLLVFEDVSQRIQSEKENRTLAHAVESVSECISITDHNDILIFVNDSFLSKYGYKKEELIGKHVSILRPPDIAASMVKDILPETIKGGWKGEVLNRKKDGTIFPVLLSTSVIKDDLGKPIALIGVATDITEIKKAQEELIKAKELAEKSAALKSEFLAQMSHEIRSPMNVTLSFTNMLKEELKDRLTPEMNEYFEGIELAGKRLIRTVDLILNASEMQIGTYEPIWTIVNLKDDIFKSIYSEYAGFARKKGLELNIISKVSDSRINGDRYSILQIFANLVDNAVKYTNEGKVEITIDRDESNRLKVAVKDTGIGMSEEFMSKMFKPFMQEDSGYARKYEGNGLGLSLVKKYCDLNEAEINVESQKGRGSKFIVTFKKPETSTFPNH